MKTTFFLVADGNSLSSWRTHDDLQQPQMSSHSLILSKEPRPPQQLWSHYWACHNEIWTFRKRGPLLNRPICHNVVFVHWRGHIWRPFKRHLYCWNFTGIIWLYAVVLKSTSVKKTTIRAPFLGGSAILEIDFITLSLFTMTRDLLQIWI